MSVPDQDPTAAPEITVTPGLVLSSIGAVVTLLAMFLLDWLESRFGMTADRSEIESFLDAFGSGRVLAITEMYFSFGWVLVLVAALTTVAVPFVPPLKTPVAVFCAMGASWTLFSAYDFVHTFAEGLDDFTTGVWLAAVGPTLSMVGALMNQRAPAGAAKS